MTNKFKELAVYLVKWCVYYAILIIPCLFLIFYLGSNEVTQWSFWVWVLRLLLIGLLISLFFRSYLKGELSNFLDFGPSTTKPIRNQKKFFNTNWTWDSVTHWSLVILAFGIVYWIMVEGMYSMFINNKTTTILFVLLVSLVIILMQFRIVFQIMYENGKRLWFRIAIYIVLDIVIFLFNFFHFYHNISQTQRMETAIIKSKELVETIYEPISDRLNTLNLQIDSIDLLQTNNKAKIDNLLLQLTAEQNRVIPQLTGERDLNTGEYIYDPQYNLNIRKKNNNIEKLQKEINELNGKEFYKNMQPEFKALDSCKIKCEFIKSKVNDFNNTHKSNQIIIKNEIVNKVIELFASLKSNKDIMKLIQQSDTLHRFDFKKEVDIIRMPDIQRVEGIGQLFDFIGGKIPEDRDENIWKIEKRLITLSVSLSALLDIIPLLLGLIYRKKEE